ncbi:MAG: micrococcal nuclease [Thiomicrorhabdus sp.]|nr:MAG: micrococcal nuclease [Thiomicrorhabdus sp.]
MHIFKLSKLITLSILLLSSSVHAESELCKAKNIELWTTASYATRGSELIIQGKKVRLIGLYSPQIERKYKLNTPGEPLAKQAQTFLNKLLANNNMEIGVEYDQTKIDEFGRQLVHLFLKDGTNIQKKILESGFAVNRPAKDNNRYAQCYFEAEKKARANNIQLWDVLKKYPDLHFPLAKSSELNLEDTGFRIIQGKVIKVMKSKTNYIINMDTTGIRISKKYWDKFDFNKIKRLKGKTIEVRGMAYLYKRVMFMKIDHPSSINVFSPIK